MGQLVHLKRPTWVVVCREGNGFHTGQAAAVKRMFEKHGSASWDFVCLTDNPTEDWHTPLRTDWPGWWSILESFYLVGAPCVLTGLDSMLCGNLSLILRVAENCPPDVLYGIKSLANPAKVWASGVTVWNGDWSFIPEQFTPEHDMSVFHGNQDYTAACVRERSDRHLCYLQDKGVDGILSYKVNMWSKGVKTPPANARVICFHGDPKPWDTALPWVLEAWGLHSA